MQQKYLIALIITLFVVSSVFLFVVSEKNMNPNYQKDWWILSFKNPADNSTDFTIENHSNNQDFHWEVSQKNNIIQQGDANVIKGSTWKSDFQVDNLTGKITIDVMSGSDKKEIYKNF